MLMTNERALEIANEWLDEQGWERSTGKLGSLQDVIIAAVEEAEERACIKIASLQDEIESLKK